MSNQKTITQVNIYRSIVSLDFNQTFEQDNILAFTDIKCSLSSNTTLDRLCCPYTANILRINLKLVGDTTIKKIVNPYFLHIDRNYYFSKRNKQNDKNDEMITKSVKISLVTSEY
jgi:hypothetical protein